MYESVRGASIGWPGIREGCDSTSSAGRLKAGGGEESGEDGSAMSISAIPCCGVLFVSTRQELADYRSLAFLASPILQHRCNSVIGLTGLSDTTMPLDDV